MQLYDQLTRACVGVQTEVDLTQMLPPRDALASSYHRWISMLANSWWLSAPKPIIAPGTPFDPDLQSWIRNQNLAPDWLRIGTDITQQGPFNAAFSLEGNVLVAAPEPSSILLGLMGLFALGIRSTMRPLLSTGTAATFVPAAANARRNGG